jgi:hypothetical protein
MTSARMSLRQRRSHWKIIDLRENNNGTSVI